MPLIKHYHPEYVRQGHGISGDADRLDGQHGSYYAPLSALGAYLPTADHTKLLHDGLGIDAATLGGLLPAGYATSAHVAATGAVHGFYNLLSLNRHTHDGGAGEGSAPVLYSSLSGIPATFTPATHGSAYHSGIIGAHSDLSGLTTGDPHTQYATVAAGRAAASATWAASAVISASAVVSSDTVTHAALSGASTFHGLVGNNVPNLNAANTWASAASFNADVTATGKFFGPNGSQTAPTYSFGASPNTGVYSSAANRLAFSTSGVVRLEINQTGTFNFGNSALLTTGAYGSPNTNCRWYADLPSSGDHQWRTPLVVAAMVLKSAGQFGIGTAAPATKLHLAETVTLAASAALGYSAALTLTPTYTAATALTVALHNYFDAQDVAVAGAGPAAVTDAALVRFNAAIGTHKCVDAASTKLTVTGVDAWVKVNLNGTIGYIPVYLSKTA